MKEMPNNLLLMHFGIYIQYRLPDEQQHFLLVSIRIIYSLYFVSNGIDHDSHIVPKI